MTKPKVAIIGLGVVGLSIAEKLSGSGYDVTGYEQFDPMHNKGSSHGDTRIFRLIPWEGEPYIMMAQQAYHGWHQWSQQREAPLLNSVGHVDIITEGNELSVFEVRDIYQKSNLEYEEIDCDKAKALFDNQIDIPVEAVNFYQKQSGVIYADATRDFLNKSTLKNGAILHYNTEVLEIDLVLKAVTTAQGKEIFDSIFICCGAWLKQLCPFVSHVEILRKPLGWFRQKNGIAANWPTYLTLHGKGVYGMPTPDGGYKYGLHYSGHKLSLPDREDYNEEDASTISSAIRDMFPAMEERPYQGAVCLYTMLRNDDFLIDRHPENNDIILFSCCSGHGFKYAPVYGEIALSFIKVSSLPFSMDRFSLGRHLEE